MFIKIRGILKNAAGEKSSKGESFLIELIQRALCVRVEDMINTGNDKGCRKRCVDGNEEIHVLMIFTPRRKRRNARSWWYSSCSWRHKAKSILSKVKFGGFECHVNNRNKEKVDYTKSE